MTGHASGLLPRISEGCVQPCLVLNFGNTFGNKTLRNGTKAVPPDGTGATAHPY
jgi:hypothetical protein